MDKAPLELYSDYLLSSIRGLMRPRWAGLRVRVVAMAAGLLGTAGLAPAEVLVSNFTKTQAGGHHNLQQHDYAQGFRTGPATGTYTLTSVEIRVERSTTAPVGTLRKDDDLALQNRAGVDAESFSRSVSRAVTGMELETSQPEPLTATIEGAPNTHGGAPFVLRVHFSEATTVSWKAMRDHVVSVTNGQLTRARRLNGDGPENATWEVTIEPSGGDVTVQLPATTDCEAEDAVCTEDSRPLTEAVTATISQGTVPPLTAEFDGPPEHDGSEDFTVLLNFNGPVDLSEWMMANRALSVTGGRIRSAEHEIGLRDSWRLTVTPSSIEDVVLTVRQPETCDDSGAVCAPDGRQLSSRTKVRVKGPASIPLTAKWQRYGDTHDGFKVFAIEAEFSWPVTTEREAMRQAVRVANGEATNAFRKEHRPKTWVFWIKPLYNETIRVDLVPTTDCAAESAICTEDGRPLSIGAFWEIPPRNPNAVDESAPMLLRAEVDGVHLVLLYREGLDESSTPAVDAFTVMVGGQTRSLAASNPVAVDGRRVRLTLAATVAHGDAVTVSYAVPAESPIQDRAGNAVVALADQAVTNHTVPLTASFGNVPASHGGGTFTFRLKFSEEVPLDGEDLTGRGGQQSVLAVTGGRVIRARRVVEGENRRWNVTVGPAGTQDVTVTLPATTDCEAQGTVCTEDDRPLSAAVTATVVGPPALSVADASATEAGATVDFTVTMSRAASVAVTVDYATSDGTATVGEDYTATTGTLTFAVGETEKTVSVPVLDDATDEDDETFTLTLTNASGGDVSLKDATATGTIEDDDEAPAEPLTASFGNVPTSHGGETFTFRLEFSEDVSGLNWQTLRDQTLEATGGTVRNASRVQSGSNQAWNITVEPDGTQDVTVTLPATTDCAATDAICTADNRPLSAAVTATVVGPPALSVADASASEAGSRVGFTVTMSRAASVAVTVDYATSDGTAKAEEDYTSTSGTLIFDAGQTEKKVSVPVLADEDDEDDETFTLTLSNASGGGVSLDDGTATGTIEDDDEAPAEPLTASFENVPASHDESAFTFALHFSEEFSLSYTTLQDHALEVTNGELTGVGRQQTGKNQAWNVTVVPNGDDDVTITLMATTDCTATGAICTADNRPLSAAVSATVAGPEDDEPPVNNPPPSNTVVLEPEEPRGARDIGTITLVSAQPGTIQARWEAPSETPADYRIAWAKVGESIKTWTDLSGNAFPTTASYTISGLERGQQYKVKIRARYNGTSGDWSGEAVITVVEAQASKPVGPSLTFELKANYPNPFNPQTQIAYSLSTTGPVELAIYTILGQRVRTLVQDIQAAGRYQVSWHGRNDEGAAVASGIYLYRLSSAQQVQVRRLLLMK